jgi:hypothetical protein
VTALLALAQLVADETEHVVLRRHEAGEIEWIVGHHHTPGSKA